MHVRRLPGSVPILKNLYAMRTQPLATLSMALRECGDVAYVEFPGHVGHMLFHPDHVRAVLVDHAKHVSKDTPGFAALKLLLGNGLVTSDGAFWLRQRRIAQPAFHRARIFALGARMVELTERTVDAWTVAARRGEAIDVAESMMHLTLRIVSDTMLALDIDQHAAEVGRAITFLLHELNQRVVRPFLPPLSWPTPQNRRFNEARDRVRAVISKAIRDKRERPESPGGDFLRMLIEARDEETGQSMDDQQLLDEVATIFAAGHETTANLLAWTWAWLARFPSARRALQRELDEVLGDRTVTAEDYARLPYTRMVLSESLRLCPPAWFISRRVEQRIDLGDGLLLPERSLVFLSPYITHRHPRYWSDPEGFDPERFSDERSEGRPTFAYFPFGGGPRKCIGDTFALVEATLILATLARRFDPELPVGAVPVPEPVITLRPRGGLPMFIRARNDREHARP
jgi:cytochrome P450